MKMKTLVPLLLASLAIPFFAFAQNRTQPRRAPVPVATSNLGAAHVTDVTELEKNITISLKGRLANDLPVDLALTGCGETFRSQVALAYLEIPEGSKVPVTGSIDYAVEKRHGLYILQYAIGMREPIATSTTTVPGKAKNTSISFGERLITGSVKCELGKGVDVFRSGGSVLTLTVTE